MLPPTLKQTAALNIKYKKENSYMCVVWAPKLCVYIKMKKKKRKIYIYIK